MLRDTSSSLTARESRVLASGISLRDLQEILAELERLEGLIVARQFAALLDYDQLIRRARRGLAGDPDNAASLVDQRYLLLLGMEGPEIADFQEALCSLGFELPTHGVYDEQTFRMYWAWLASVGRLGSRQEAWR